MPHLPQSAVRTITPGPPECRIVPRYSCLRYHSPIATGLVGKEKCEIGVCTPSPILSSKMWHMLTGARCASYCQNVLLYCLIKAGVPCDSPLDDLVFLSVRFHNNKVHLATTTLDYQHVHHQRGQTCSVNGGLFPVIKAKLYPSYNPKCDYFCKQIGSPLQTRETDMKEGIEAQVKRETATPRSKIWQPLKWK